VDQSFVAFGFLGVELANIRGRMGIGIEIDMHFKPQTLGTMRAELEARVN